MSTAAAETLMFAEAAEAAAAAERQLVCLVDLLERLGRRLRDLDPPFVITCARGSSDHAVTYEK
jgi:glucosamine--fructose-6-phosphate aminotransferase (isomerizing)